MVAEDTRLLLGSHIGLLHLLSEEEDLFASFGVVDLLYLLERLAVRRRALVVRPRARHRGGEGAVERQRVVERVHRRRHHAHHRADARRVARAGPRGPLAGRLGLLLELLRPVRRGRGLLGPRPVRTC